MSSPVPRSVVSVVVAAHNEEAVIGSCLDTLLAGTRPGELDVTVAANGCTDATVARATRPGVRVIEVPVAGKALALNAADEVAVGFPRVYLDADIRLDAAGVRALAAATGDSVLATVPRRRLDTRGCSWPVRAYGAVSGRLPAFEGGLFGRGAICLSAAGRSRFDAFPAMVADDLFLDGCFTAAEKHQVDAVTTVVAAPRRTRDLLRRLVRVRRGNAAMRATGSGVRDADRWSWLRDVVLPRPWLAPAGVVYVVITVLAAIQARRTPDETSWGRDESTRVAA